MKKLISLTALLAIAISFAGCTGSESITEEKSDNLSSHLNSEQTNSTTSEESNSSSQETNSDTPAVDEKSLEGEKLIAEFEWLYEDEIDLSGATAHSIKGDAVEKIAINEISNEFLWNIQCDYGYLATIPEQGNEYKYQKYKAGDKIGNFTITEIYTQFNNSYYETLKYFAGTKVNFDGEVTLTGEISILKEELAAVDDIKFYPDEESKKKLPVVDFRMKSDGSDYDLLISLSNKPQYANIDFSNIPTDGTRVRVELTIEDYGYRAMYGLPFIGGATIVGDSITVLD